MHDEAVFRVVPGGIPERVVAIPQRPSGLGWLPNGDLLIASMLDRKILRHTGSGDLMTHADVSAVAERRINEMLVDALGRAWVGNFGFDLAEGEPVGPGTLARVDLDGTVHAAAADLLFANGMALLAGGETLVVAETFRGCLTAFDIASNSDLINRRVWAQCPDCLPFMVFADLICPSRQNFANEQPGRADRAHLLQGADHCIDPGGLSPRIPPSSPPVRYNLLLKSCTMQGA